MYSRWLGQNSQSEKSKKPVLLALLFGLVSSANAWSEGSDWILNANQQAELGTAFNRVEVDTGYVLGVDRFDLDEHTEILGWRLNDSWYFGRQDGDDSGLTLVWQATENQVSLSKDGVRLTRRF